MPLPFIAPPLINTANPWASTKEDLRGLFACPYTGAVTTRTSLLNGFLHDDSIHQHVFFDASTSAPAPNTAAISAGSLNTLGYSPIRLSEYMRIIADIADIAQSTTPKGGNPWKPCIVSVTGTSEDVMKCYHVICETQRRIKMPLCMEVNLSCPNIPDKPPPAYSKAMLKEYLQALRLAKKSETDVQVPIGLKTPPYTYHDQFSTLVDSLHDMDTACPIDFISAVNTLGSSLVLGDSCGTPALASASGLGIGGMAGAPLHPLALGNVKTLRLMLDRHGHLKSVDIIGIGGVSDKAGFQRMQAVGATVVGVGTALGHSGVAIFEKIMTG